MERVPYLASAGSQLYEGLRPLPVYVALENVRSLYNVGSFFRTADAAGVERLLLCGYTGYPPHKGIHKTALGAEDSVAWEHAPDSLAALRLLRERDIEIAAIETTPKSVDLFDWTPRFPVCLVFGNEVEGLSGPVSHFADTHVRLPMLGLKHSLNVATAGGIVLYELLRKYRRLREGPPVPAGGAGYDGETGPVRARRSSAP